MCCGLLYKYITGKMHYFVHSEVLLDLTFLCFVGLNKAAQKNWRSPVSKAYLFSKDHLFFHAGVCVCARTHTCASVCTGNNCTHTHTCTFNIYRSTLCNLIVLSLKLQAYIKSMAAVGQRNKSFISNIKYTKCCY